MGLVYAICKLRVLAIFICGTGNKFHFAMIYTAPGHKRRSFAAARQLAYANK